MKQVVKLSGLTLLTTGLAVSVSTCTNSVSKKPMNVVYILVDDLGYGDVGCYGQQIVKTPHIDSMAKKGVSFTQHYSGSTVSAPSRCSFMTGLHTGHAQIRGNKEINPEGQTPMAADTYTLGAMFKSNGYATGLFGKWGLGYPGSTSDANSMGFEEFYGNNCQRKAHSFYPEYMWHNREKVEFPENKNNGREIYGHDLIHNEALDFIREHKDEPFFAMLTYTLPHAELAVPKDSIYYMYDAIFNEESSDAWKSYEWGYYPPEKRHTTFAAMVSRLDMHVGEVLAELKKLGIDDNTMVFFTSDNGPHVEGGADPEFFNSAGPLRGVKRDLYEGGVRVPLIAWSPNNIPSGVETDHISAFWDIMPTLADVLEVELPVETDGISFLPTLIGDGTQENHDHLYWEFHMQEGVDKQSVRDGDWKFIYNIKPAKGQAALELFNLKDDLGERSNLAEKYPEKVKHYQHLIKEARTESSLFKSVK